MTGIDIVSGFLGAGKTTFIQRLLSALKNENVVLIENEFGEIGIDGGFLKEAGIEIREMNQGCICCSLVGDFEEALKEVINSYKPDRIIIEPSGVGKLSDIESAVRKASERLDVELHSAVTVVDAKKARVYTRNFGEFFNNQIEFAGTIILSRTDITDEDRIKEAVDIIRNINKDASVITTPLKELSEEVLINAISKKSSLKDELLKEAMERVLEHEHHHDDDDDDEHECCHHHHHDDDDDDDEHECCHHHHHDDDDDEHECCHHHNHDDDDEHECCHHHHHDDDDDEHECCHHHHEEDGDHVDMKVYKGHHHHHHHGGDHDADEVFTSWGIETPLSFDRKKIEAFLQEISESEKYGLVVRAKGMLKDKEGKWMYFDMVPSQTEIRDGSPDIIGKAVVIGSGLKEDLLEKAFSEAV